MIIALHSRESAVELVAALTSAEGGVLPRLEGTVVAVGGRWWARGWQQDLQETVTGGLPLTALTVRQGPAERVLTVGEWSRIAVRLVTVAQWTHASWMAVRTGPRSMRVLAADPHGPSPASLRQVAKDVQRDFHLTPPTLAALAGHDPRPTAAATASTEPGPPMRILDARLDSRGRPVVLVDRLPDLDDLRFTPYDVPNSDPSRHRPGPDILYVAVRPDGYVDVILDAGDGQGYHGAPFDVQLVDGTRRTVVGPWPSSPEVVNAVAPQVDVYPARFVLVADPRWFHQPDGHRTVGYLTRTTGLHVIDLAARNATSDQTHARAKPFPSPTSTPPPPSAPAPPTPAGIPIPTVSVRPPTRLG